MFVRVDPQIFLDGDGDVDQAKTLIGFAKNQRNILKNLMGFNGLQQDQRIVKFDDGSVITVQSCFGIDKIWISCPPSTVVLEELISGGILLVTVSYTDTFSFLWNIDTDDYLEVEKNDKTLTSFKAVGFEDDDNITDWKSKHFDSISGIGFWNGPLLNDNTKDFHALGVKVGHFIRKGTEGSWGKVVSLNTHNIGVNFPPYSPMGNGTIKSTGGYDYTISYAIPAYFLREQTVYSQVGTYSPSVFWRDCSNFCCDSYVMEEGFGWQYCNHAIHTWSQCSKTVLNAYSYSVNIDEYTKTVYDYTTYPFDHTTYITGTTADVSTSFSAEYPCPDGYGGDRENFDEKLVVAKVVKILIQNNGLLDWKKTYDVVTNTSDTKTSIQPTPVPTNYPALHHSECGDGFFYGGGDGYCSIKGEEVACNDHVTSYTKETDVNVSGDSNPFADAINYPTNYYSSSINEATHYRYDPDWSYWFSVRDSYVCTYSGTVLPGPWFGALMSDKHIVQMSIYDGVYCQAKQLSPFDVDSEGKAKTQYYNDKTRSNKLETAVLKLINRVKSQITDSCSSVSLTISLLDPEESRG